MKKITHLGDEWRRWILENLARGCTPASMIEQMVGQHFDLAFATLTVERMQAQAAKPSTIAMSILGNPLGNPLGASHAAADVPYQYEAPRLPELGNVISTNDRAIAVAMRIAQPVVALFHDVLSHAECDALVALARKKLKPSTIVDPSTGKEAVIAARSSSGCFFALKENEFIAKLDTRIAELMHWPIENGEGLQILNYQVGAEYKTHFDYFSPTDPGSQVHLAKGGQRVSTLIIYLNEVEGGGETILPELGLRFTPKKGAACYFEYCNSLGQLDSRTLHGGLPVTAGEKWIATKWMRERRYG